MRLFNHAVFAGRMISAAITGRRFPLITSLAVTNRCNMRCIYCYGSYFDRDIKDFPFAFWRGLIDEAAGMGTALIQLGGGEPLLRDDIGEFITYIKSRGMICRMNSNGILVPEKINVLKKLDSLCISLDGDEESNDKNRGKGTYKKIVEGIRAAKRCGLPVLTSTVLTANNVASGAIENILSLAKEIGFGAQFNFLYEQTAALMDDEACIVKERSLKDAVAKLIRYKEKGWPVFYSTASYANALNWPVSYVVKKFTSETPPPAGFKYIPCYMGKFMCFVDGDGKIYPCGEHIGTFPALNVLDVGFKKAWENVSARKDCITCYNTCFNEYNQLFDLRPGVVWNNLMNYMRGGGIFGKNTPTPHPEERSDEGSIQV